MSIEEKSVKNNGVAFYGSDLIVDILKEYEIEYVAANIGATFRGLWDSLINYGGDNSPKTISCCHEEIAVAIAHGYAKATGKPMVALIHDTVGLHHATMAIFNAWCDRVPVILLSATGPLDASKRRPWIDWVHTSIIPNELVRNYVKWDDFPFSITSVRQSFVRAYNATVTPPTGPVFLSLDTEYLEEMVNPTKSVAQLSDRKSNPPPSFPPVSIEILERLAKFLLDSQDPLIVAGSTGSDRSAVGNLIQLAEVTGSRVLDGLDRFNFPNTHALDSDKSFLTEADSILALDVKRLEFLLSNVDDLTRSVKMVTRSEARMGCVGLDELLMKSWSADYQGLVPVEFTILADTGSLLPRLVQVSRKIISGDPALVKKISERLQKAKADHERSRASFAEQARLQYNDSPISLPRLASEVWQLVKGRSFVIANGTLDGWTRRLWDWEEPGCYLGPSGAAGLGYGLPASVGAALGLKNTNKLVIDLQPDGDMLYTATTLWTAAHYEVPLLVVMFNNRLYHNDAAHNKRIAESRGRNSEHAYHNGGDIDHPAVDFAMLSRSQGVWGEGPITKPQEIRSALERALKVVQVERKPALVDIVTKAR